MRDIFGLGILAGDPGLEIKFGRTRYFGRFLGEACLGSERGQHHAEFRVLFGRFFQHLNRLGCFPLGGEQISVGGPKTGAGAFPFLGFFEMLHQDRAVLFLKFLSAAEHVDCEPSMGRREATPGGRSDQAHLLPRLRQFAFAGERNSERVLGFIARIGQLEQSAIQQVSKS